MQNNKTKVALIYDFDETLSTQYMPVSYTHLTLPTN